MSFVNFVKAIEINLLEVAIKQMTFKDYLVIMIKT